MTDADPVLAAVLESLSSGSSTEWNQMNAEVAAIEWDRLDRWVTWLRDTYGLPAAIIPPLWHRHQELVEELAALSRSRKAAYRLNADPHAALRWHADFTAARERLRRWVADSGTALHNDRPTRHTGWPGEREDAPVVETPIRDRTADFQAFIDNDLSRRRDGESRREAP